MMPLEQIDAFLAGPALVAALILLGLAIGVLTGLFGVGGAFLLNPILMVAVGIHEPLVIGSSLSFTIGASAMGAGRHMRSGNADVRAMIIIGLGAVLGAVAGTDALNWFAKTVEPDILGAAVRGLYFLILVLAAWLLVRNTQPHRTGRSPLQRLPLPPRVDLRSAGLPGVSVPGLLAAGLVIGLATGMLGIGGGVLFMPLLLIVVGMSPHKAVGTSLGAVFLGALAGTIRHGLYGNVSLIVAMCLLAGSSVGVQIGAAICERMHAARLKRYFAGIVLLTATMVAADLIRMLVGFM